MQTQNLSIDRRTPYAAVISENPLKTPQTNNCHIDLKTYVITAYSTGAAIGQRNSGAFFSGVISGRKKKFQLLENEIACHIGCLASIIASICMIYLFNKENAPTLITAFSFTTISLKQFIPVNTVVLIASFFTKSTTLTLGLITFSAYVITVTKLFNPSIGEEFGQRPTVKKIIGTSCGALCATTEVVLWGTSKLGFVHFFDSSSREQLPTAK